MGSVVGPDISKIDFHGAGTGAPQVGHPAGEHRQRLGEFDPGQVRTEAVVHSPAERQHGGRLVTGDVEALRFVVRAPGPDWPRPCWP